MLRPWHGECPFQPAGRVPHIATLAGRYKRGGIRQPMDSSTAMLATAATRPERGTTGANRRQGWELESGQNVSVSREAKKDSFGRNDLFRNSA